MWPLVEVCDHNYILNFKCLNPIYYLDLIPVVWTLLLSHYPNINVNKKHVRVSVIYCDKCSVNKIN